MRVKNWDIPIIVLMVTTYLVLTGWVEFERESDRRTAESQRRTETAIVQSLPSFLKGGLMKSGESLYLRTDDGKVYKLEETF